MFLLGVPSIPRRRGERGAQNNRLSNARTEYPNCVHSIGLGWGSRRTQPPTMISSDTLARVRLRPDRVRPAGFRRPEKHTCNSLSGVVIDWLAFASDRTGAKWTAETNRNIFRFRPPHIVSYHKPPPYRFTTGWPSRGPSERDRRAGACGADPA